MAIERIQVSADSELEGRRRRVTGADLTLGISHVSFTDGAIYQRERTIALLHFSRLS